MKGTHAKSVMKKVNRVITSQLEVNVNINTSTPSGDTPSDQPPGNGRKLELPGQFQPKQHQQVLLDYVRDNCMDGQPHRLGILYPPGLGKTITSLAAAMNFRCLDSNTIRSVIIICPASLQLTWEGEMEKFGIIRMMQEKKIRHAFVSINAGAYVYKQFLDAKDRIGGMDDGENITVICDEVHLLSMMLSRGILARLHPYMGRGMRHNNPLHIDKMVADDQTGTPQDKPHENTEQFFESYITPKGRGANGNPIFDLYKALMRMSNVCLLALSGSAVCEDPFELAGLLNIMAGPNVEKGVMRADFFPMDYYAFTNLWENQRETIVGNIRTHVKLFSAEAEEDTSLGFPDLTIKRIRVRMSPHQWKAYEFINAIKKEGLDVVIRLASDIVPPKAIVEERKSAPFDPNMDYVNDIPKELLACDAIKEYACKMHYIVDFALKNPDVKFCVYSEFVETCLTALGRMLEANGITYISFTSKVEDLERAALLKKFNQPDNWNGSTYRCVLFSRVGFQGLSFRNSRVVFILEPAYNALTEKQVIDRSRRVGSHAELVANIPDYKPMVTCYKLYALNPEEVKPDIETTDCKVSIKSALVAEGVKEIMAALGTNVL